VNEEIFEIEAAIKILAGKFQHIQSIYLFGSRRFNTGSSRSDIDILITTSSYIKPSKLRDFIIQFNTALDIFVLENCRATSIANDSYIEAENDKKLIDTLNAVLLYDKDTGVSQYLKDLKNFEIDKRQDLPLTSLPNESVEVQEIRALKKVFEYASDNALPIKPYLGKDINEASECIIEIIRSLISSANTVSNNGQAKLGWTKNLKNEYDFQNLFWITVKPWLPNLSRETVTIKYDNQEKYCDFSLFDNQLIIEFKHITSNGKKAEVVKTLEGLKQFYKQHPNVRVLIFAILVEQNVDLDERKWEVDFSYTAKSPKVKNIIVRNV